MREKITYEAVKAWNDAGKVGTIVLPTGFGKTFTAIKVIAALKQKNIVSSVLIIVPRRNLLTQWRVEFNKWGISHADIDMKVINTACKPDYVNNLYYDLIVIDEIHTALSEVFCNVFNIKHRYILGLTATLPSINRLEAHTILHNHCPVVHQTSMNEIAGEVVSDFKIINIPVKMSKKDASKYTAFTRNLNRAKMMLSIMKKSDPFLSEFTVFDIAKRFSGSSDKTDLVKYSKQFWSNMSIRKQLCYNSETKVQAVLSILKKYPNKKWILFNKSISFAEKLLELIPNSAVYHYKVPKNNTILEDFENNKYLVLIAVDALNAGFNVPDVDGAICVSGVSTELTQVQQLGRTVRKTSKNKIALFINLYCPNTVEENWVKTKTQNLANVFYAEYDQT